MFQFCQAQSQLNSTSKQTKAEFSLIPLSPATHPPEKGVYCQAQSQLKLRLRLALFPYDSATHPPPTTTHPHPQEKMVKLSLNSTQSQLKLLSLHYSAQACLLIFIAPTQLQL